MKQFDQQTFVRWLQGTGMIVSWILTTAAVLALTASSADAQQPRSKGRPRQPEKLTEGPQGPAPLASVTAGKYLLEVVSVDPAEPSRASFDIAAYLGIQSFEQHSDSNKEQFGSGQNGGTAGSVTGGAGGGGGGGGSFRAANTVLGIRVLDQKTRKPVKDAFFSAGYTVTQAEQEKSESTLPPMYIARYVWPEGKAPESGISALPLRVADTDQHTISSLTGTLVVVKEESAQIEFSADDVKRRARKTSGRFAAEVASLETKDDKLALSLSVSFPPGAKTGGGMGQIPDFRAMMQTQMSSRVLVYVEDTLGGIGFGAPQSRSGGGGSSNSSFTFTGPDGIPRRGGSQKKSEPAQTYPFLLRAVPENAATKRMVCEIRRATGEAEVIPFTLGELAW